MLEYKCGDCNAEGVKLWRLYNTFLDHQELRCAKCSLAHEKVEGPVDAEGKVHWSHGYRTDQIGNLIPAVPTVEGDTYWGYTSVPQDRVDWWKSLPTELTT